MQLIPGKTYLLDYTDPDNSYFDYRGSGIYTGKIDNTSIRTLYEFNIGTPDGNPTTGLFAVEDIIEQGDGDFL
jgi:hypothetical protein